MGLTLDPQLIRDLTVLITSSTVGGMVMEALRQPVINGYFIAGSVVGPGGLKLVKVWPHQALESHWTSCSWSWWEACSWRRRGRWLSTIIS